MADNPKSRIWEAFFGGKKNPRAGMLKTCQQLAKQVDKGEVHKANRKGPRPAEDQLQSPEARALTWGFLSLRRHVQDLCHI